MELDFGITGSKVRIVGIFCNYVRQITLVSATLEIFFIHHHTQYDVVTSDVHKYTNVSKHVDKTMTRHDYTSWFKLSSLKLELLHFVYFLADKYHNCMSNKTFILTNNAENVALIT